jgi:hypothetical protein
MSLLIASLFLLSSSSVLVQGAMDPTGHWEGTLRIPGLERKVEVDLARKAGGEIAGRLTLPEANVNDLPLKVKIDRSSIHFHARTDQPFEAVLSADGKSMSATYTVDTHSFPLTLIRTGEPKPAPPISNPAISKQLEGTWNGIFEANGIRLRYVLVLSNEAAGTGASTIVSLDEGDLEIPVSSIIQDGSKIALNFKAVGGVYSGTVNIDGTELLGTYTQGPLVVPVTFRRAQ